MSGSNRWANWNGRWPIVVVLALFGCDVREQVLPSESQAECRTDADCSADQRCERDTPAARRLSIPMPVPCVACTEDSQCSAGSVCKPLSDPIPGSACMPGVTVCQPSCEEIGCGSGQLCRDDVCVAVKCDEPDAPACPERWTCDPTSSREQYPDLNVAVAGSADTTVYDGGAYHLIAMGCVRNLCDAPDGFTCGNGWTCAPDAPESYGTGCLPTPCEEWGSCSSPNFVCEPTNEFPRRDGTDPHGCLSANCLESETLCSSEYSDGVNTAPAKRCDPGQEGADESGCIQRLCDEVTEFDICTDFQTCAPSSPNADVLGCVAAHCEKGTFECEGGVCDPTNPAATDGGCVYPSDDPAQGGAGSGGAGPDALAGEAGSGNADPNTTPGGEGPAPTTPSGPEPSTNEEVPNGSTPSNDDSSTDDPARDEDAPDDDGATSEAMQDADDSATEGGHDTGSSATIVGRCVDR